MFCLDRSSPNKTSCFCRGEWHTWSTLKTLRVKRWMRPPRCDAPLPRRTHIHTRTFTHSHSLTHIPSQPHFLCRSHTCCCVRCQLRSHVHRSVTTLALKTSYCVLCFHIHPLLYLSRSTARPLAHPRAQVIRSKADVGSAARRAAAVSNNDIVIGKLCQILSYLRQGARPSKRRKVCERHDAERGSRHVCMRRRGVADMFVCE